MKSNMHNLICTSASSHGDQLSAELNWPGSDQRKRNSNASLGYSGHQFPTTYGSICMQNRNVGYDLCYIYSSFFFGTSSLFLQGRAWQSGPHPWIWCSMVMIGIQKIINQCIVEPLNVCKRTWKVYWRAFMILTEASITKAAGPGDLGWDKYWSESFTIFITNRMLLRHLEFGFS